MMPPSSHGLLPLTVNICASHWITGIIGLGFGKAEVVKTSGRDEGDTS